ncbi:class I SAM-dependent methyltransferase [Opitutales bacterium]|nr:class I SAM-dependent methyltransferase [Opitutales bacterium]
MPQDQEKQTVNSFRDKWIKNKDLAFTDTLKESSNIQKWILRRNGFNSLKEFQEWLVDRGRILDAGCGNGRVTALLQANTNSTQQIVGIDLSSAEVAAENLKSLKNVDIHTKDLLGDLTDLGHFDLIYCQEVFISHIRPVRSFFKSL